MISKHVIGKQYHIERNLTVWSYDDKKMFKNTEELQKVSETNLLWYQVYSM